MSLTKSPVTVGVLATASRWQRFINAPLKCVLAIFYAKICYRITRKSLLLKCDTFFDKQMTIALPAGIDIYLTGGKTHDSEIRLAQFIINNLKAGDCFIDVGAHYGYFTLLAESIVKESGSVHAFEASHNNFSVLAKNAIGKKVIRTNHNAVADVSGELTFYEFPNLYNEYNSLDME